MGRPGISAVWGAVAAQQRCEGRAHAPGTETNTEARQAESRTERCRQEERQQETRRENSTTPEARRLTHSAGVLASVVVEGLEQPGLEQPRYLVLHESRERRGLDCLDRWDRQVHRRDEPHVAPLQWPTLALACREAGTMSSMARDTTTQRHTTQDQYKSGESAGRVYCLNAGRALPFRPSGFAPTTERV